MKTLELDSQALKIAQRRGQGSAWAIAADKNMPSVNDQVQLIEVSNAEKSEERDVGSATIDQVLQKRLVDVTVHDIEDLEFGTIDDFIHAAKTRYGPNIQLDTPVMITHFVFSKSLRDETLNTTVSTAILREAKLYADGGSRGNPGPSASGYVLLDMNDHVVVKNGSYLGVTTNNQAEYQALKSGLEEAIVMGITTLHVYMDSMLVINQMNGLFKVKNRDLWPIHDSTKQLAQRLKRVTYTHVPRELNKLADHEVNQSLDAQARQYA